MKNQNVSEITYNAIKEILLDGHFKDISFMKVAKVADVYRHTIINYMVNKDQMMASFFQQFRLRALRDGGRVDMRELVKFFPYVKTLDILTQKQFHVLIEKIKMRFDDENDFCNVLGKTVLKTLKI